MSPRSARPLLMTGEAAVIRRKEEWERAAQ